MHYTPEDVFYDPSVDPDNAAQYKAKNYKAKTVYEIGSQKDWSIFFITCIVIYIMLYSGNQRVDV